MTNARTMRVCVRGLLAGVFFAQVFGWWASLPAADAPQTVIASLPQDTFLVIQVAQVDGFLRKVKASPLYAALKDRPEAKVFDELTQTFQEAKETIGFDVRDLLGCFGGEAVLALGSLSDLASRLGTALSMGEAPEISAETIPLLIVADAGNRAAEADGYLEKLFSFAEKEGALRESMAVGDAKITVLIDTSSKSEEEPKEEEGEDSGLEEDSGSKAEPLKLYFGSLGTRRYFSTSRKLLEGVVSRKSSASDSLAQNKFFADSRELVGSGDVLVYANVKHLTDAVGGALSSTFFSLYWQKIERIVFGKSFNSLLWSLKVEDRGLRSVSMFHNSGADDGLAGVMKAEPFPAAPANFVPATALTFSSFSFSPSRLGASLEEGYQLIASFQGPAADLEKLCTENLGVGFKDLVAGFGGKFHFFSEALNAEQPLGGMTYAIELKDPAPLRKALGKLVETPGLLSKSEPYKGNDVLAISLGDQGQILLSATEKLFVLTGDRKTLEKVIDAQEARAGGLAEKAELRKLLAEFAPPEVNSLGYMAKGLWANYFRSFSGIVLETAGENRAEVESVLRLVEALANALGEGVQYGRWNDKGYREESLLFYR